MKLDNVVFLLKLLLGVNCWGKDSEGCKMIVEVLAISEILLIVGILHRLFSL